MPNLTAHQLELIKGNLDSNVEMLAIYFDRAEFESVMRAVMLDVEPDYFALLSKNVKQYLLDQQKSNKDPDKKILSEQEIVQNEEFQRLLTTLTRMTKIIRRIYTLEGTYRKNDVNAVKQDAAKQPCAVNSNNVEPEVKLTIVDNLKNMGPLPEQAVWQTAIQLRIDAKAEVFYDAKELAIDVLKEQERKLAQQKAQEQKIAQQKSEEQKRALEQRLEQERKLAQQKEQEQKIAQQKAEEQKRALAHRLEQERKLAQQKEQEQKLTQQKAVEQSRAVDQHQEQFPKFSPQNQPAQKPGLKQDQIRMFDLAEEKEIQQAEQMMDQQMSMLENQFAQQLAAHQEQERIQKLLRQQEEQERKQKMVRQEEQACVQQLMRAQEEQERIQQLLRQQKQEQERIQKLLQQEEQERKQKLAQQEEQERNQKQAQQQEQQQRLILAQQKSREEKSSPVADLAERKKLVFGPDGDGISPQLRRTIYYHFLNHPNEKSQLTPPEITVMLSHIDIFNEMMTNSVTLGLFLNGLSITTDDFVNILKKHENDLKELPFFQLVINDIFVNLVGHRFLIELAKNNRTHLIYLINNVTFELNELSEIFSLCYSSDINDADNDKAFIEAEMVDIIEKKIKPQWDKFKDGQVFTICHALRNSEAIINLLMYKDRVATLASPLLSQLCQISPKLRSFIHSSEFQTKYPYRAMVLNQLARLAQPVALQARSVGVGETVQGLRLTSQPDRHVIALDTCKERVSFEADAKTPIAYEGNQFAKIKTQSSQDMMGILGSTVIKNDVESRRECLNNLGASYLFSDGRVSRIIITVSHLFVRKDEQDISAASRLFTEATLNAFSYMDPASVNKNTLTKIVANVGNIVQSNRAQMAGLAGAIIDQNESGEIRFSGFNLGDSMCVYINPTLKQFTTILPARSNYWHDTPINFSNIESELYVNNDCFGSAGGFFAILTKSVWKAFIKADKNPGKNAQSFTEYYLDAGKMAEVFKACPADAPLELYMDALMEHCASITDSNGHGIVGKEASLFMVRTAPETFANASNAVTEFFKQEGIKVLQQAYAKYLEFINSGAAADGEITKSYYQRAQLLFAPANDVVGQLRCLIGIGETLFRMNKSVNRPEAMHTFFAHSNGNPDLKALKIIYAISIVELMQKLKQDELQYYPQTQDILKDYLSSALGLLRAFQYSNNKPMELQGYNYDEVAAKMETEIKKIEALRDPAKKSELRMSGR